MRKSRKVKLLSADFKPASLSSEECWRDSKTVLVLVKQLSAVKRAAPLQVSLQRCVLSVCLAVAEHAPAAVIVLSMLWLALSGTGDLASKRALLHFVAMMVQVADIVKRTTGA